MATRSPFQQSELVVQGIWRKADLLQQMYHVKQIATVPPGGLDMNIADEEEFSPDKLRSNIERLYMTIVGPGSLHR
jgi:hypothetical protein